MEDVDFQVKKKSIAEGLKTILLPEREMPRKFKIRKFLLSENIMTILKERINN